MSTARWKISSPLGLDVVGVVPGEGAEPVASASTLCWVAGEGGVRFESLGESEASLGMGDLYANRFESDKGEVGIDLATQGEWFSST